MALKALIYSLLLPKIIGKLDGNYESSPLYLLLRKLNPTLIKMAHQISK